MATKQRAYLGLGFLVSLILAIIPITAWVLGVVTRLQRGRIILGILNIPFGFIFWIIDLISMIINKDLVYLA